MDKIKAFIENSKLIVPICAGLTLLFTISIIIMIRINIETQPLTYALDAEKPEGGYTNAIALTKQHNEELLSELKPIEQKNKEIQLKKKEVDQSLLQGNSQSEGISLGSGDSYFIDEIKGNYDVSKADKIGKLAKVQGIFNSVASEPLGFFASSVLCYTAEGENQNGKATVYDTIIWVNKYAYEEVNLRIRELNMNLAVFALKENAKLDRSELVSHFKSDESGNYTSDLKKIAKNLREIDVCFDGAIELYSMFLDQDSVQNRNFIESIKVQSNEIKKLISEIGDLATLSPADVANSKIKFLQIEKDCIDSSASSTPADPIFFEGNFVNAYDKNSEKSIRIFKTRRPDGNGGNQYVRLVETDYLTKVNLFESYYNSNGEVFFLKNSRDGTSIYVSNGKILRMNGGSTSSWLSLIKGSQWLIQNIDNSTELRENYTNNRSY